MDSAAILLEGAMRKTRLGVHKFVLGTGYVVRYSPRMEAISVTNSIENKWKAAPSLREILVLSFVSAVIFVATITHFRPYALVVQGFGDNGAYIATASAIRHWNFTGLGTKQFWGYSYVMAAVSALTGSPEQVSLLAVSCICSVCSVVISFRLWGPWIAGLFALTNFEWYQRSYLGGSEPVFMLLLLVSFLAARKDRWVLAAALASCATLTRPVGFLALLAIGFTLLARREPRKLALCVLGSIFVGTAYLAPFWFYFGDPLYQVHRYQSADWHSGSPLTWPFLAIAASVVHNTEPWTNLVLTLSWILLVLAGAIAILRKDSWLRLREHPVELAFALLYIGFLFSYNSAQWARADFVRFAIPAMPFVFLVLLKWMPRDRRVLWALASISPLLAAASALGIRNVVHALRG